MLKIGKYTNAELSEILKTGSLQKTKDKLKRLGVEYNVEGKSEEAIIDVKNFQNEFKVFCILDVGFNAATDFDKLKYFINFFFNDDCDDFRVLPKMDMAKIISQKANICRQTVSKYINQLEKADLIMVSFCQYKYYAVSNGERKEISRELYSKSWQAYWNCSSYSSSEKILSAAAVAGGFPTKRPLIYNNAFYLEKINRLNDLSLKAIQQEVESK